MLAKQKLIKRARAELPPEDFPKFVEVMKSVVSAESSDVAVHESMKTLAKLCKIEKRGVGPSTLWAAIGIGLTLKDAAKKAYDAFEEKAKRRMEEKTTRRFRLVQSQSPQPPPPSQKKYRHWYFRTHGETVQTARWFRTEDKHQNQHLISSPQSRRRKPLVTTAKPPCATDRSSRPSAATLRVTSVSTPSLRASPRKRQTTIKTTKTLVPSSSDVFQTHHQEEFEENVLLVIDT